MTTIQKMSSDGKKAATGYELRITGSEGVSLFKVTRAKFSTLAIGQSVSIEYSTLPLPNNSVFADEIDIIKKITPVK